MTEASHIPPGAVPEPPVPPGGGSGVGRQRRVARAVLRGSEVPVRKPTVEELGIDVTGQDWRRSGVGDGTIEVAMVTGGGRPGVDWVLMRVAGDPAGRVLVYDRHEWECFLDGVRNGEFDDGVPLDALE